MMWRLYFTRVRRSDPDRIERGVRERSAWLEIQGALDALRLSPRHRLLSWRIVDPSGREIDSAHARRRC